MRQLTALCVFIAFCTFRASAQTINRIDGSEISITEITETADELMKKGNVHGMALSVVSSDQIIYQKAFGWRDIQASDSLKVSHGIYAASFSKSLFAYIVMNLVEEEIIDLDKPLQEYLDKPLPEYAFKESYEGYQDLAHDERYKQITARMCLTHTTGLPNWRYIGKFGINFNKELEIERNPGTYYSYSGEGIYLLQFVVEQVTQTSLEDLAKKYVFDPLEMTMTSFEWQDRFEGNRAVGHYKKDKTLPVKRRTSQNAAGSMETTPEEFTRFIQAMLNGYGLTQEIYSAMISPQVKITSKQQFGSQRFTDTDDNRDINLSYGLGWGIYETPHGKAVFKEGHIQGWEHYCIFYPGNDLGIVIMTNSSNGESIFKELLEVVAGDSWMPWYWEGFYPYKR